MLNKKYVSLFFYGLVLSSIIGGISFLFLFIERILTSFIWEEVPLYFDNRIVGLVVICLTGSLLVGGIRKLWPGVPRTAHETLDEFKANQTLDYRLVIHSLVSALIILSFGAGVGPEATLLGAVISLSIVQADKMRYFYFNYTQLNQLDRKTKYYRLLNPFNYHLTYDQSRYLSHNEKIIKKILLVLCIFNGLISFVLLLRATNQPGFITKLGESQWFVTDLWLILPVAAFAIVYKKAYELMNQLIQKLMLPFKKSVMIQALIGGLSIFLIAYYTPRLLFSGQQAIEVLVSQEIATSFLILSGLGVIKLIFLEVCLHTGWIGGNIFPIFLAAILQGFGIAVLLPNYDSLFVVAIVSTCLSLVMIDSPVVTGIFILLFFPLNLAPVIISLVLSYVGVKKIQRQVRGKGLA